MKRMKEGKCKRCSEKWDPNHKFDKGKETKNLYKCEVSNDSYNEELEVDEFKDSQQFSPELDNENILQVSLSAMIGISQPQTLKLKGNIKKSNVMVLIDTSNIHNFLDSNVVKRLNILSYPMPNMKVMVSEGKKIEKVGKYHKVNLKI